MKRLIMIGSILGISLLSLSGCVVHEVEVGRPPAYVEVVGVRPYRGAIWYRGYWHHGPRRWNWVHGHWR